MSSGMLLVMVMVASALAAAIVLAISARRTPAATVLRAHDAATRTAHRLSWRLWGLLAVGGPLWWVIWGAADGRRGPSAVVALSLGGILLVAALILSKEGN